MRSPHRSSNPEVTTLHHIREAEEVALGHLEDQVAEVDLGVRPKLVVYQVGQVPEVPVSAAE